MRNLAERKVQAILKSYRAGKNPETIAREHLVQIEIVDAVLRGDVVPTAVRRRPIPTRRCPRCDAKINLWPCRYCVPDVLKTIVGGSEDETREGLTGSQEQRKSEVDRWREEYGHPDQNPDHPLRKKRTSKKR